MARILNLSQSARYCKYIVYRVVNGENWYYGAYNDLTFVSNVLHELGECARVIESENVD